MTQMWYLKVITALAGMANNYWSHLSFTHSASACTDLQTIKVVLPIFQTLHSQDQNGVNKK